MIELSIMPTVLSSNTNAGSIVIGEKGADLPPGVEQRGDRSGPTAGITVQWKSTFDPSPSPG
ncbi:MAG: hypothetical protein ACREWJ_00540 [Rhodoferax sp.]